MTMRPAAGLTAALLCLAARGRCHKDENNNECYATDRVTGPYVQQKDREREVHSENESPLCIFSGGRNLLSSVAVFLIAEILQRIM